jgi:flagellin
MTVDPSQAIAATGDGIDKWGTVRSTIGAMVNTLEHAARNLESMVQSTSTANGRIMDTDYDTEASTKTAASMLTQSSSAMLKNSASVVQLALSLLS